MKKLKDKIEKLSNEVMDILGPGYNEIVYEKALAHELRIYGVPYVRQTNIEITYKGYYLKDVKSDIIIDNNLLLELKKLKEIGKSHIKQAQVYMFSLDIDDGIVLSFSPEGEVLRRDVEKPILREPKKKVVARNKKKKYGDIEKILKSSVKEIMKRFGTEFLFTEAQFDMYVKALGVDLTLKNVNFKSGSAPILYKDLEVDRKDIEFILDDNTGVLPFSYTKDENIEKEKEEIPILINTLNLDSIWLVGFPMKEELDVYVENVKG